VLLTERLRTILRGSSSTGNGTMGNGDPLRARPLAVSEAGPDEETATVRQSRGLEQFFSYIRGQVGLSILDLAGVNQENVNFITDLGHKLYSEDFLRSIRETFGNGDVSEQASAGRIDYFLKSNLNYGDEQFDGVLVWDLLEYMGPPLLAATLDRLFRISRPKSYMLAFFHSDEKAVVVPYYSFRIQSVNKLLVSERGGRKPAQLFNNRGLEKLFQRFESVKFFLTRERLREVIVKK
jgi:hypothetical protein